MISTCVFSTSKKDCNLRCCMQTVQRHIPAKIKNTKITDGAEKSKNLFPIRKQMNIFTLFKAPGCMSQLIQLI